MESISAVNATGTRVSVAFRLVLRGGTQQRSGLDIDLVFWDTQVCSQQVNVAVRVYV